MTPVSKPQEGEAPKREGVILEIIIAVTAQSSKETRSPEQWRRRGLQHSASLTTADEEKTREAAHGGEGNNGDP